MGGGEDSLGGDGERRQRKQKLLLHGRDVGPGGDGTGCASLPNTSHFTDTSEQHRYSLGDF